MRAYTNYIISQLYVLIVYYMVKEILHGESGLPNVQMERKNEVLSTKLSCKREDLALHAL
jgi:hypothetical protein